MEISANLLIGGIFILNAVGCFVFAKVVYKDKESLAKIMNMGAIASLVMAPVMFFLLKK